MSGFIEQWNVMQTDIHSTAVDKGWWEDSEVKHAVRELDSYLTAINLDSDDIGMTLLKRVRDLVSAMPARNGGEVIALMHSELSEALEALRKDPSKPDHHCPEYTNFEVELADVVIRIMDFAGKEGLRVAEALVAKQEYNKSRPYKHGKKF